MTTDLVSKAMMKAYNLSQPSQGLVFHSDRGSQYTSKHYRKLLTTYGIRASMGDVGALMNRFIFHRAGSYKRKTDFRSNSFFGQERVRVFIK